ncbi:hypothetical protein [Clostridium tetani]|uniref:Phage protein n=1 Tax=Clostridium tetani TaxID=1513 RepID=A0ABY0EWF8_CLOTA|nr:hypothetical protein [Clostridium tetani]RXI58987.1 hypothetical protein DP131_00515 [Clostridium tetani]
MSTNKLIIDTLKPLGVPTRFQTYEGKEETYITFFCYNEQGESYADDIEIATGFYMQIDLWSKGNLEKIKENTIKLLKANGFIKRTIHDAPYEPDTGIFHKVLRFFYYVENKEDE